MNEITVIAQALYGNRTMIEIDPRQIGYIIDGWLNISLAESKDYSEELAYISLPETECVLVYNKVKEKEQLQEKKRLMDEENYSLRPLAVIPQSDMEIYSRCLVCRIDENGQFLSVQEGDENIFKYLAE